jgi:hypothetical protein
VQRDATGLQFVVYQPVDKTGSVRFAVELGNLSAYSYTAQAADTNYAFVGGGGEGTARTIREGQDSDEIISWGRVETFVDRRDTTSTTELDQAITQALAEGAGKTDLSITPIDRPGQTYLTHYDLGDKVTAVIGGAAVQELVREVRIVLSPESQRIVPTIATPGRRDILAVFRRLARLESRMTNLERR